MNHRLTRILLISIIIALGISIEDALANQTPAQTPNLTTSGFKASLKTPLKTSTGQPRWHPPHVHNNLSRCPAGSGGCALFDENAIAISSSLKGKARRELYRHEIAHFIDHQLFTPRIRHRIKRILLPKAKWFHRPYPTPETKLWYRSAGEAFAVAYTLCPELRYWHKGDIINLGFRWWSKKQLRLVCRLTNRIRRSAKR